ncbi:hypothetical protein B0H17DRAFT_168006 [Mycena rosella]|uniref:WH2 domain-containing protein n=1 Tax=Mycena rosella TaxID=1033263 RepID=A0AAD7DYB6_MYCRO|nr:hypothetical protein B0H17DRAFT_168006 [Mycena rosella]
MKMKMSLKPKSRRASQKVPAPPPGLKSLVLVGRLQAQQDGTPVKKPANPGTRLLRLLGLKKEPVEVEKSFVHINKATARSKAPFVVPLCYDTRRPAPQVRAVSTPVMPKASPIPRKTQAAPRVSSRPLPRCVAVAPAPRAAPRAAPRPLLRAVPQAASQQRVALVGKQAVRPAKMVSPPASHLPRASSAVLPLQVPRTVPPRACSAPPGLKLLCLSSNRVFIPSPAPVSLGLSFSAAPKATVAGIARSSGISYIPRYIGRRSTSSISLSSGSCAFCGSSTFSPGRPVSDASDPTTVSDLGSTSTSLAARSTSTPSASRVGGALSTSSRAGAFAEQTTPRRTSVEIGVQTDLQDKSDEEVPVDSLTHTAPSPPPPPPPPPPPLPPPPPPMKRTGSSLLAAIKARRASASTTPSKPKRDPSALMDELKDKLARRKLPSPQTGGPGTPSSPKKAASSPFAALRSRRPVKKENVVVEEGELLQVFKRRKANGGRIPLGGVDVNASSSNEHDARGARKVRRIVVPPVVAGTVPSRDPRIMSELERLRAQGKVAGGKVAGLAAAATAANTEEFIDAHDKVGRNKENPEVKDRK